MAAPRFFAGPAAFRAWLERHHRTASELLVGFHKRHTGRPSLTWPESVDEALCFGWIDGVRRRRDAATYTIRFAPRKRGSIWSVVNLRRARALVKAGRMRPAGLRVFEERDRKKSGLYSFEQRRKVRLPPRYARLLHANPKAWDFFQSRAPWYRHTASFWIISAKREETRLRRLGQLIACSVRGRLVGPLDRDSTRS